MKQKTFLNIQQLISKILNKGIKINDIENTKKILKHNNYYVVMGYKHLFLDGNKKYKQNISFDNIYNLYLFDKSLRIILLENLLDIENIIKTSMVNHFCSIYGFTENEYLDRNNYNVNHKYVDKTLSIFKNQIAEKEKNHSAITYYKNTYGFVPFWVVSKIISFGLLRELYSIMKDSDKIAIKNDISNFGDVKIKNIFTFMQLYVDMRNRTCHDEILFNEKHKRILLPKLREHSKFILSKNNGLNDLLGLLITMKNTLDKHKYNIMIDKIDKLINNYVFYNNVVTKEMLLKEMGLPINYLKLKW